MQKLKMVAAKYLFHKMVKEFFKDDPEVQVSEYYKNDEKFGYPVNCFTITVKELYRETYINKMIGGLHPELDEPVFVHVVVSDDFYVKEPEGEQGPARVWNTILRGHKQLDKIIELTSDLGQKLAVVCWKPALVQIPCDSAFNPDGLMTYTYEQLAGRVFFTAREAAFTTSKIQDV